MATKNEITGFGAGRYADLRIDEAFKKSFAKEGTKSNLIGLLERLIDGIGPIRDVTIEDKEVEGFFLSDKKSIFDVRVKTDNGETIVVEMQLSGQKHFMDRALFYSTYPIRQQLSDRIEEAKAKGEAKLLEDLRNYALKPVYVVSITNFAFESESEESLQEGLLSSYSVRNDRSFELMTNSLHFVFLELGRFGVEFGHEEECSTPLQRLVYTFLYSSRMKELPAWEDELITGIMETSELVKFTASEREKYDKTMYTEIDRRAQLDYAIEKGLEEGRARGLKQGLEQGLEQGLKQGLEQGLEQGRARGLEQGSARARKEIAGNLLAAGVDIDTIASATGLDKAEVEALRPGE